MGEVEAAFARQQKLAADRRHGVVELEPSAAAPAACQRFGCHQAGRAAADDGYTQG
jgi:hypothetical protein